MNNSALSKRLTEERQRLGQNQTKFGLLGGVSKRTQINYENGEKAPDTNYLLAVAAAGADIIYILTAESGHGVSGTVMIDDEKALLADFRKCSQEGQQAVRTVATTLATQ